jgi:hypothetical protein
MKLKHNSLAFVLDKRWLLPIVLLTLGMFGGIKLHSHLRLKQVIERQTETTIRVQHTNELLISEKTHLEDILDGIRNREGIPGLSDATAFSAKASQVFQHLHERTELLASKEQLLWQKEMQLDEARALVTARSGVETEMAQFINVMAEKLISMNMTIPNGLSRKPFVSNRVARLIADRDRTPTPQFNFMIQRTEVYPSKLGELSTSREKELAVEGASILAEEWSLEEGLALLFQKRSKLSTQPS